MPARDIIRDRLKKNLKRYGFVFAFFPATLPFAGLALATQWGYANLFAFTGVIVKLKIWPVKIAAPSSPPSASGRPM